MTNETKKYKKRKIFFQIMSFLCTVAPLLIYVILGFAGGAIYEGSKIFLGFTTICAVLLVSINILFKHHLRSPLFLLLLGVYCALNEITTLLIIISIGTILDEFFFQPALKSSKQKYTINKEIDKR